MKILITGGAGYLGSVLVSSALEKLYKVNILDILMFGGESILPYIYSKDVEFIKGDIRDNKIVKKALSGVDVVCHLAALVGEPACAVNPILTEQINYEAAVSIGKIAKLSGIRKFIFTSTCSNYGLSDIKTFANENSPLNPLSLYSKSKIKAEKDLLDLSDEDFSVCILRLGTLFGLSGRMRFNLLINEMVREAYFNKKILLYKESAWRPYAHIKDASEAILRVIESDKEKIARQIFNVGTENYQKKELVKLIKKYVPDLIIEKKGGVPDNRDYRVSFNKIKKSLGFNSKITISEGIDDLFRALRNNLFDNPYEERYVKWINEKLLLSLK